MEAAIAGFEEYFVIRSDGRCHCNLNNHTFSTRPEEVSAFIRGPKFQRLRIQKDDNFLLKRFEPFIQKSKNFPDKLYCSLTCHVINRDVGSVERHIQGKKYKQAKELYDKGEHQTMDEPDLEDEAEDMDGSEQTRAPGGEEDMGTVEMDSDVSTPDGAEDDPVDDINASAMARAVEAIHANVSASRKKRQRVRQPRQKRRKKEA